MFKPAASFSFMNRGYSPVALGLAVVLLLTAVAVTPLTDCRATAVQLPRSRFAPGISAPGAGREFTISVKANGESWLGDTRLADAASLRAELIAAVGKNPGAQFSIAADSALSFSTVKRTMRLCHDAGIRRLILQTDAGVPDYR